MASETPKPSQRPSAGAANSSADQSHSAAPTRGAAAPSRAVAVRVASATGVKADAPGVTLKSLASPVRPGALATAGAPDTAPTVTASAPKPAPAAAASAPVSADSAAGTQKDVAAPDAGSSFKLPAAVYSPQLLESVIYDLQYYLDWIRQNQIRKTVGAKPKDEPNHADETAMTIEAWLAGQPATVEAIEALLGYLRKLHLPEVHITLAALPNRTQRLALVEWFRNNASQDLLLSFVADRNLGGGVVIRTPNRVFDFTWKQELVAARDKLAGILKSV